MPNIHPHTVAPALDHRRNVNTFYPRGHGRMVAPRPAGANNAIELAQEALLPEINTVGEIADLYPVLWYFPKLGFSTWRASHSTVTVLMISIDKTLFEVWTMAPDWGDAPAPDYWTETTRKAQ